MVDGIRTMLTGEAKELVGREATFLWFDERGRTHTETAFIKSVCFVPRSGPCLITDKGDFRLDRILGKDRRSQGRKRAA